MGQRRRIGIYGGTFDPVHLGHVEVARSVLELFEIDEVLFVPALHAPHKLSRAVTSAFDRYAMLTLATHDDARLFVSTFELDAPDRRYTVQTVARFQEQFGSDADLFFIMGADSWSEINTWREWERLLTMINHIVVTRPGFELRTDHLPGSIVDRIEDLRGASADQIKSSLNASGKTIFLSDAVMRDISATRIRRHNLSELEQLVPAPVAQYIRKYNLYRDGNEN
jgi:nicotinate-nucleotide adenylyltransferase